MHEPDNTLLEADGIRMSFGEREVLQGVSFTVAPSEVIALVGPSGCGKSTLLRILAGLLTPSSGFVKPSANPPLIIFQDYQRCLFPHMTAEANVRIALRPLGLNRFESHKRAEEALARVGLRAETHFYPSQLSGGMQQRVLLARCFALQTQCILLDEPLASVDAMTRYRLEDALRRFVKELSAAIVYVTHDLDSAIYMADRVIVLSDRPARIKAELSVDLGVSRSQRDTRASAVFGAMRARLYELVATNVS